jgi:hypothetical protein
VPKQKETWKREPEEHDFPAAGAYLSLLFPPDSAAALVEGLRTAETETRQAKDLLRASELPLLPAKNPHVAGDLKKVARGEQLSPVLLVRGDAAHGRPLLVADGYHRICASWYLNEDTNIPCRVAHLA